MGTFFQNFGKKKKGTAALRALIELFVIEIAPLLMWMVYFGVGHHYRLPEL